jgi:hypothetical protein
MAFDDLIRILEIVVWPVAALVAFFILRRTIARMLGGAKVKLSIAGQSIETTLPEINRVIEELMSEPLSERHISYLRQLHASGIKQYHDGINDDGERDFLRTMRNAGLIQTIPRAARLKRATGIDISALGKLFLKSRA